MSDTIRIIVKSDADEIGIAEEKLKLKGYETSVSNASNIVLDGTDLGGHLDYLSDTDGEIYIVIGIK